MSARGTTVAGRRRIAGDRARQRPEGPTVATSAVEVEAGPEVEIVVEPDAESDVETQAETEPTEVLDSAAPVESDAVEADEDEGSEPEVAARVGRVSWSGLVGPALAACLVALLVACALSLVTTRRDRADAAGGTAALAAAKTSAATILSYDYRHLDSDFAAATALTTGSLRTDYQATTSKAVAQLATQTHAVVVAKVVSGGVVTSTATRATVLLFVDQTTTSNRLDGPKVDQNRVQLTLRKSGSHWLVSALSAL